MRAVWSGSLSFGLITIPVKLMSAVQQQELDLDLLSKDDMAPVRYARIDTQTGEELEWKDIVKGYQYAKGKYVVVSDEDFEKASPAKSKSIVLDVFTQASEIDPVYFEKPYYLVPAKDGAKAYVLLMQALEQTGAVGVAEFVLRNRQHVCCIRPHAGILLLNQLRYAEEIQAPPQTAEAAAEKVSPRELDLAVQLITQMTAPFDAAAYKDNYIRELKRIVKAKAAGKNIRIAEPDKPIAATVKDLMAELKRSLDETRKRA